MVAKRTSPKQAPKPRSQERQAGGSRDAGTTGPSLGTGSERSNFRARSEQPKSGKDRNILHSVTGTASRVVQRAASILEEEIAAGIVAARRVEERLIDVQKLRTGNNEEVMQRFRDDAHQVIDILMDLVNLATNSIDGLAQRAVTITGNRADAEDRTRTAGGNGGAPSGIPSLTLPTPVKPGSVAHFPFTLQNGSDEATESFQFVSSDLVNTTGDRISAEDVKFEPTSVTIAPRTSATVTVSVRVPKTTKTGVYSGLLQATRRVRAVLILPIAE